VHPVLLPRTTTGYLASRIVGVVALTCIAIALVLAFFWAPVDEINLVGTDAVQRNFEQKIFFIHVPIAFAAYAGFFLGAWNALLLLWTGNERYDIRSYVGIHVGMVFGTLVLATGSLWAKASWGVWWQWGDRQLLVFLILYLFYGAWFMLRFSIDSGRYRSRVSAVFALVGITLVPLSFLAIRIANTVIHPIVIKSHGLAMPRETGITFLISSVGFIALAVWMAQLEVTAKVRAASRKSVAAPDAPQSPAAPAPEAAHV
jgi:heme exporter protein C